MTARTARSMLNLNQVGRRFFFEPERSAVPKLAARVEPRVEEVARHDVAERLEHRLLDARMLAFEVENEPLHALPLQAQIAAGRTAAADDGQPDFLAVETRLVLTHVDEGPNDNVLAIV